MLLCAPRNTLHFHEMLHALRIELEQAGQELPEEHVFVADSRQGYTVPIDSCIGPQQAIEQAIAEGIRFSTLVCCHDYAALGALRALRAAGMKIPDDVAVVSGEHCSLESPGRTRITTVNCHREEQAFIAAQLLLRRIDGYDGRPEVHYVPGELIAGQTVEFRRITNDNPVTIRPPSGSMEMKGGDRNIESRFGADSSE